MGLSEPSFSANIFHKDECLFLNLAGLSGPFLLCERFSAKMVPFLNLVGLSGPFLLCERFSAEMVLFLNLVGLSGLFLLCERFSAEMVPFLNLVGLSGLEPPTSRLSGVRSNRLSYKPKDKSYDFSFLYKCTILIFPHLYFYLLNFKVRPVIFYSFIDDHNGD